MKSAILQCCSSVEFSPRWSLAGRRARPRVCRRRATRDTTASPLAVNGKPVLEADDWFFTESGQKGWFEAMELNTITPELPELLTEMGVQYDPDRLSHALRSKRTELVTRALQISTSLGTFIAQLVRDYATGQIRRNMKLRARQLTTVLTKLGPSFVKVGQALSARPDLFPRTYLEELSTLQDQLPSFPQKLALTVIEQELGSPVDEIFADLSEFPVAAASLGQVYKGKLKTGEDVAVKVQRPGIGENIALDMILLRRLMAVVDKRLSFYQPIVPLVDEFAGKLFAELDYIAEGHNCEKFQSLYGDMDNIRTPKIYWNYSARRVLTMEWIDGVKLTDDEGLSEFDFKLTDFINVGLECSLRQLLEHGFFHADPHPGNLLATREGDLVFLDFGMMSTAPVTARYALIAHVVHLVNRDYLAMCQDYYELDFMDPSVDTTPIAPALANFFDDILDQSSVSKINFKTIIDGLGDVLFEFPFQVPGYYALIIRSLTVLEGLALQADPDYRLLDQAYTYMASRLLTDPEPRLRQSLQEVLFKNGRFRWNRLENLVNEGSKSQSFQPQQMWLLLNWIVSPGAEEIRDQLAKELSTVLDAVVAESARQSMNTRFGVEAADALVPELPREKEARQRAEIIATLWQGRSQGQFPTISSTGLFGTYTPADLQKFVNQIQELIEKAFPPLYESFRAPGGVDLVSKLSRDLLLRFAARSVKLFAGAQEMNNQTAESETTK